MRWLDRATPVVTLAVALLGVTCALPTDKSNEVFIAVHVPKQVVLQGQVLPVSAQLWQRTGADSVEIKNASFQWGTTNEALATVKNTGYGDADVTGITPGNVDLTVRAISFEKAPTQYVTLRVSKPLEIDSVRPTTAHFGELLTVYGVGVDSIFVASLAGVNLIEYPFSRLRDSAGLGQIKFWVPPPAHTDSLFYLGAGVFGFDTAMTDVLKQDVYEPNDSTPASIDLDLGGPWPGTILAPILFLNPALAFEPVERDKQGEDWFRFTTSDSNQALTFFITYPSVGTDTAGTTTFLLDSLSYLAGAPGDPIEKFYGRDSADFVGSDFYTCKGSQFDPLQVDRESTTVALKTLPSHAIHIVTFFSKPQRYGLTVANGYFTADSRIKADRFEENDFCHFTDSLPGKPNPPSRLHIATAAFSDTANIDNPFEIDWYRIEVPSMALGDSVLFRLQGRPFVVGRDSSDIDIYVLTVPGSTGSGVIEVGSSTKTGSSENLMLNLAAGSYYVAVVDYAGVATRYSMCIRKIVLGGPAVCNLIASPPASVGAPKRMEQPSASARAAPDSRSGSLLVKRHRP
ncbi:MAG TPA: hypothetical protein VMR92_11835, partial [Gemmatimonadales bacterium]|nr:hypothetical protein [Gemmatimonadales bacterium]